MPPPPSPEGARVGTHHENLDICAAPDLRHQPRRRALGKRDGAQDGAGRLIQTLSHTPDERPAQKLHFTNFIKDEHLSAAPVRRAHLEEEEEEEEHGRQQVSGDLRTLFQGEVRSSRTELNRGSASFSKAGRSTTYRPTVHSRLPWPGLETSLEIKV